MIIRVGLSGLLALSLLLSQNLVLAAVSDLSITDRQLVSKQRVSRSAIDYTYTLTIHNAGESLSGVVATVSSLSGSTVIQQAEVVFRALDSGSTQSTETFVLRQDRRVAFDPADLVYTFTADLPAAAAMPDLSFEPVKIFRFSWADVDTASHYKLLENPDGKSGFTQVGEDIPRGTESIDHVVPLYTRINAQYILQSCNATGCRDSAAVSVSGTLVGSIGYFKASNFQGRYFYYVYDGNMYDGWHISGFVARYYGDQFGLSVSLSGDGNTLAVGAPFEDSRATGVNGDQGNNLAKKSGAVYIFTRSGDAWTQQAYVKASNTGKYDRFGSSVNLSGDGNTLAVGAPLEDSGATGVNGYQHSNSVENSGAVYVFTRSGGAWAQRAYVKASKTREYGGFGAIISLSEGGSTLAVGRGVVISLFTRSEGMWFQQADVKVRNSIGALSLSGDGGDLAVGIPREDSAATGVNGDQNDNSAEGSGAVYVFTHSGGAWTQQAYVKASNTGKYDGFGSSVSLSGDGNTLAVGAPFESSGATGVNGDQNDNSAQDSGAAYIFMRSEGTWFQQAYVKASNAEGKTGKYNYYDPDYGDRFGTAISLSGDGNTLVVGAPFEGSSATGVNGDQSDNWAETSGAAYTFTRSEGTWFQQAYIKASNTRGGHWGYSDECDYSIHSCRYVYRYGDRFGGTISLSRDGKALAVGAVYEGKESGAVYLY